MKQNGRDDLSPEEREELYIAAMKRAAEVSYLIWPLHRSGLTALLIAKKLNDAGEVTQPGAPWTAPTVRKAVKRLYTLRGIQRAHSPAYRVKGSSKLHRPVA